MSESLKPQNQQTYAETSSAISEGIINGFTLAGKVAGGAVAGVALFSTGSNVVEAHDTDISEDRLDSPEMLYMDDGDTVYIDALDQGYTHDEIELDLINHGLTSEKQWNNPGLAVGDMWEVSQEVVNMRAERIGDVQTVTLDKGQTVWGQATKNGVDETDIPELLTWIEDSQGGKKIDVTNLPVGFTFTIPERLLGNQSNEIVPLGFEPKQITVVAGSSIINELEKAGVRNPMDVIDEVLQANNMDENDARKLSPGTIIEVPAGIIHDSLLDSPPIIANDVITIDEGSSIFNELLEAGVDDPMEVIEDVLEVNNLSNYDATRLDVGTVIKVPEGIIPNNNPNQSPTALSPIQSDTDQTVASINSNGGVGTDEYGPPAPSASSKLYDQPPAPTESVNTPETVVPTSINDVLIEMRLGYVNGKTDTSRLVELINNNFTHPSIDTENGITEENVNQLYMLPNTQQGFEFTVNPQTCAKESITSAPMLALIIATQDYANWLTQNNEEFNYLNGVYRLDIGDANSGNHKTHQYGLAIDLRSIFDNHTDYANPNGPLFMTGRQGFNMKFTEYAIKFIENTTLNGSQMVDHVVISSEELEFNITGANKKGDFVAHDDSGMHSEHVHIKLKEKYTVPGFFSPALPLSCDDAKTGGPGMQEIAPPQVEVVTTSPVVTPEASAQQGYWVLSENNRELIDQSNLSAEQKEFLTTITDSMMAAINSGANINPRVALAQAVVESGWGTGKGAVEGNNIFSVKANRDWALQNPDQVVWIYDDEYDQEGNKIESAFKKYASVEDAFKDYSRMITEAEHYDDAERCRGDDAAYLNGLIHELRENCSIGRMQGEEGVLSYATNEKYVQIINDVIKNSAIDKLIVLNPDEQQRQAAQEWLLLHGG